MTDHDILERILDGSLVVDLESGETTSNGRTLTVIHRTHKDGPQRGTYRFFEIWKAGKRKKIARHRLVWLAATRQLIPDGFDVDHRDDQDVDGISNLCLLPSSVNRALGAEVARTNANTEEPF